MLVCAFQGQRPGVGGLMSAVPAVPGNVEKGQ